MYKIMTFTRIIARPFSNSRRWKEHKSIRSRDRAYVCLGENLFENL